jgi:hypothetical protein
MSESLKEEGYLVFTRVKTGTKSEHFAPLLVKDNGETRLLKKEGDNPFMHESLREYHLSYCQVTGEADEKTGTLKIGSIERKEDPAKTVFENSKNLDEEDIITQEPKEDNDE